MRNGIMAVGSWIVDSVKFIDTYPTKGNLVSIRSERIGVGGCSHNVLVDLARLDCGLPLYAGGCIGADEKGKLSLAECARYGIDAANMHVLEDEHTSYSDVMSEIGGTSTRTFFHYRGANACLTEEMVTSCDTQARIFLLGYLLLLDKLDEADAEYGVVAARALDALQKKGYKTAIDVVSEEGDRFRSIVLPCLKYVDYLIINEVEAGACLGVALRDKEGRIDIQKVKRAASCLLELGSGSIVAIHFPEGGVAVSRDGEQCFVPSDMVPAEEIVSAVGAGDAFCAGALYSIHEGYSLKQMLEFANASARFNLKSFDATSGAPALSEIERYLESRAI